MPADPIVSLTLNSPENFPIELLNTPHWILWRAQYSKERQKYLKLPAGKDWPNLRQAITDLPEPHKLPASYSYGFIYSLEHNFICIDVDDASPSNTKLVELLDSYTEWSPSEKGAHVIVSTDDKPSLVATFGAVAHSDQKRDLYIASGYVTVTGRLIHQSKPIKHLSALALKTILTPYFNPIKNTTLTLVSSPTVSSDDDTKSEPKSTHKWVPNYAQIKQTLDALPVKYLCADSFKTFELLDQDVADENAPESREAWLTVGQALHDLNNGDLIHLEVWKAWSSLGNKYDEHALFSCWRSFSTAAPSTITFATIQKLANSQRPFYVDFTGDPPRPQITPQNVKIYIKFARTQTRYNVVTNNIEVLCPSKLVKLISEKDSQTSLIPLDIETAVILLEGELLKQGFRGNTMPKNIKAVLKTDITQYNPIKEHFENTLPKWDNISRLPQLMATIKLHNEVSSETPQVYEAYVRAWLIQVMAAVFTTKERPNRLNNVLILQGDQGAGKTMWVESLFPPGLRNYCVGSKSVNMSQFRNDMVKLTMELTNTLICNINEIDTVFKAKTFSEFKSFLDNTTDKIVLPYGYGTTDILRSTVFIGSTNQLQLFTDQTGNRRFMLIDAISYNFEHNIDLNQLWAEAYHYYMQGEKWYFTAKDIIVKQRQSYDNVNALNIMDDMTLDLLNNTFDHTKPLSEWTKYTFPRIQTVLGLKLRANSYEFKVAKRTVIHWLSLVTPNPQIYIPKHQGSAWQCLMPPLKTE